MLFDVKIFTSLNEVFYPVLDCWSFTGTYIFLMMTKNNCRVCGLYLEEAPWGEDGKSPNYDYCPCCGVEFGNQDYNNDSILRFRRKWMEDGALWAEPEYMPVNWILDVQLNKLLGAVEKMNLFNSIQFKAFFRSTKLQ